jgi:PncC family amidohydrolase
MDRRQGLIGVQSLLPLATDIGARLKARAETVAISESSAGGLISAAILAVPGASVWYRGGGVIYTPQAFRGLLGLRREDLGDMRSSTEPYARLLARTIAGKLDAHWGLCETGASGPTGNGYGDAAGHTCVALSGPGKFEVSRTLETGLTDRPENMRLFAREALELLRAALD